MCWPEANTEEKTRNKSWDRINGGDSARNREDERGTSLMLKSGENEWSNGTPVEGIYGNGGVENTDGRQILMRSLAALHIHAMKIHRLLCNDRRRRPTGWIKSTLDYRLTLIDGSRSVS